MTSREVYNRIRFDARFDASRFTIGYRERGKPACSEKPLAAWDETIPWHRVEYFSVDGRVVWDRAGKDLLDEVAAAPSVPAPSVFETIPTFRWTQGEWTPATSTEGSLPLPLRIVTWNVLSDRHHHEVTRLDRRLSFLLQALREQDADVLALQEVTKGFLGALLAESWVRERYWTSDRAGTTLAADGQVVLVRGPFAARLHAFANQKRALAATLDVQGKKLEVVVIHLTSDLARDAAAKRAHELATVSAHVASSPDAIVAGDWNALDDDPGGLSARGFQDAWRALRDDAGDTFEPARNSLAGRTSVSGLSARFDRVVVKGSLEPRAVALFGNDRGEASDHNGLAVVLDERAKLDVPAVVRSALAVLLPEALSKEVQEIRKVHDPAYPRWMPHVNLLYGFVPAERSGEAAELVARVARLEKPFPIELARFGVFAHKKSATVHLVAESSGVLERLGAALAARFPQCPRSENPHLTVARFDEAATARAFADKLQRDWKPIRFVARSLAYLVREENPFRAGHEIPLGARLEAWLGEPSVDARRERIVDEVRTVLGGAPVHVAGSTRLGVALPSSDLDLVVATTKSLDEVGAKLVAAGLEARVAGAKNPIVRFEHEGLFVDLAVEATEGLPRACREVDALVARAHPRFQVVLRAVRTWARARRLDAQAWGFLGGHAWALLVAWALEGQGDASPDELFTKSFEKIAAHPWPEPVSLEPASFERGPHDRLPILSGGANAARNVTRSTFEILEEEIARAWKIAAGVLEGTTTWSELVERPRPRGWIAGVSGEPGLVEAQALGLVLELERAKGVRRVRPFPGRGAAALVLDLDDPRAAHEVLERFAAEHPALHAEVAPLS